MEVEEEEEEEYEESGEEESEEEGVCIFFFFRSTRLVEFSCRKKITRRSIPLPSSLLARGALVARKWTTRPLRPSPKLDSNPRPPTTMIPMTNMSCTTRIPMSAWADHHWSLYHSCHSVHLLLLFSILAHFLVFSLAHSTYILACIDVPSVVCFEYHDVVCHSRHRAASCD